MAGTVKDLVKYAVNRRKYPGVRFKVGASFAGQNTFGSNVDIGTNSYILHSSFGDNVKIFDDCRVFESKLEGNNVLYEHCTIGKANIGAYSYLSQDAHVGTINIGRFCSIGPGLKSGFGIHPANFVSTSPVFFSTRKQCGVTFADRDYFKEYQLTSIGHDVWIGNDVYIKDGTTIGDGAIIAAGAVVTKDVAPYAIVGGVPAKLIRFRFTDKVIDELLDVKWWNWPAAELQAAQSMFAREGAEALLEWHRTRSR